MATGTGSLTHISGRGHRPLPTAKPYTPHRPWCIDCKTKHDADQLDTDGRCQPCVEAAASKADADRRYAEREAARQAQERADRKAAQEPPQAGNQGKPTTRRSAPRATSTSRTSGRAPEAGSATPRRKNPPAARETRPAAAGGPRTTTDTTRIRLLYLEGNSIPEVARLTGHVTATIRRVLIASRIELRDDRRTKSGGKPVEHTPEVVEAVRRTYLDEQLTIRQTADKLGLAHKAVTKILERHDIPRRPDAFSPGYQRKDQAKRLKDEIADLGVPVRQIKEWAIGAGLLEDMRVGLPSAAIVTAYRAALNAGTVDAPAEVLSELQEFAANTPASLIRLWASRNGHPTGDRGPLPQSTRMAYAEHQYQQTREST